MSQSLSPFQFYTRKILYPRCFLAVACIPRTVIRHITSDFDVSELDLDMQMGILNAAPRETDLGCKEHAAFFIMDIKLLEATLPWLKSPFLIGRTFASRT